MGKCKLGDGEHLKDVRPECALDVTQVDFLEVFAHSMISVSACMNTGFTLGRCTHLLRSIVNQDVQLPELLHVTLDKLSAVDLFHEIAGNKVDLGTCAFYFLLRGLSILVLLGKMGGGDSGAAFTSEHVGGCSSNPTVSASDYCCFIWKPVVRESECEGED